MYHTTLSRPVLALTMVVLCLTGCGADDGQRGREPAGAEDVEVSRTAREGPVTLTLSATPAEFDLSRHATVRAEILAETGVTVSVDSYERALHGDERHFDYRIVNARRERAVPTGDDRLRWTYEFELEFVLPGEYELPPASLSFVDERSALAPPDEQTGISLPAELHTLETEPLTLVVQQASGVQLTPEEMMTITTLDPVELPRKWSRWWWAGALLAMAVAAVGLWQVRRRRQRPEAVIVIPAHEWAQGELAALLAEDLVAKGRFRVYCYRVSDIVRGYIERRFRVAAPEMTTEEFLTAAATDRPFGETTTEELNRFLNACDLVKYAKYQPTTVEAKSLLETAYAFVEQTRERPWRPERQSPPPAVIEEHAA